MDLWTHILYVQFYDRVYVKYQYPFDPMMMMMTTMNLRRKKERKLEQLLIN